MLYCRILCIIDILTLQSEANTSNSSSNGASLLAIEETKRDGWNPDLAIEVARQVFVSNLENTSGKRKREANDCTMTNDENRDDIALVMSLLLYDQRENVPETSRARRFLTFEFRESVAEQLNCVLLGYDDAPQTRSRVSRLETFLADLETLQKECLHHGCRVYPESVEGTTDCKRKITCRRASMGSNSDDFSSSQSEDEDQDDDDRDE
ncbi:hypothetical protein Plhal304r1_c049g0131141 [Plasmopara halstedii]